MHTQSAIGSSCEKTSEGRYSRIAASDTITSWWSVPKRRATLRAQSSSLRCSCSEKPTVKVRTGWFISFDITATFAEESIPPESSTPKGTSDINRFSTAASKSSFVRRTAYSRSAFPLSRRSSGRSSPRPGSASQ